jgi:hypothetical protein
MHKTIKYFTKINKQYHSIISNNIALLLPYHHFTINPIIVLIAATTLLTKDLVIFATWLMHG